MKLSGRQFQQLQQALLSAFPSRDKLEQMTRMGLEENLNVIAESEDLSATVYKLIVWSEAEGRLPELVEAARERNPGNRELHDFVMAFSAFSEPQSPPESEKAEVAPERRSISISNVQGSNIVLGDGNQVQLHQEHDNTRVRKPTDD